LAHWDVFHADRLELERGLDTAAVRHALECGDLRDDDLVRPAGTTVTWSRLAEVPELTESTSAPPDLTNAAPITADAAPKQQVVSTPEPSDFEVESEDFGAELADSPATLRSPDWVELRNDPDDVAFPVINDVPPVPASIVRTPKDYEPVPPGGWLWAEEIEEEDEDFDEVIGESDGADAGGLEILDDDSEIAPPAPQPSADSAASSQSSRLALPVVESRGWDDVPDDRDAEDEDEGDLSLSRGGPETVEELDLAPMVDVAFQLVLFFMVTATTVLYKTLEIPKPSQEQAPTAVAQGRSLADLQDDNILVEIDASGAMKIDREPAPASMESLVERLRTSREKTNRKSILLSADFATKHKDTVVVIDAAHEIGMNIVIARPAAPQGPAPSLLAQPPAAAPAAPP
jgi:biopolymer transport protein ExbD